MSYLHFCLAHTFSPFRSRDLNSNSPYCMSATHFLLCQLKDQMISHSWYVLLFLITLLHNSVLILKAQISFKSHYHFGELNFQSWRISFLLSSLKTSLCRITTTFPAGLKEINIENKSQESISEDYKRLWRESMVSLGSNRNPFLPVWYTKAETLSSRAYKTFRDSTSLKQWL